MGDVADRVGALDTLVEQAFRDGPAHLAAARRWPR
jgi:hypothetical protein